MTAPRVRGDFPRGSIVGGYRAVSTIRATTSTVIQWRSNAAVTSSETTRCDGPSEPRAETFPESCDTRYAWGILSDDVTPAVS
jgi:hypothetical protein